MAHSGCLKQSDSGELIAGEAYLRETSAVDSAITSQVPQRVNKSGAYTVFVTKVNAAGSALVYSTILAAVARILQLALLWTYPATHILQAMQSPLISLPPRTPFRK